MMNEKDVQLVLSLTADISNLIAHITSFIPDGEPPILKHLAACSIHLVLFIDDFNSREAKRDPSSLENFKKNIADKFISKCGCGFKE